MRLFIPTIGTRIKLVRDWEFTLQTEYRNNAFIEASGVPPDDPNHDGWRRRYHAFKLDKKFDMLLPAETILRFDCIYIRKGSGEFDSVTFCVEKSPDRRFVTKKNGGTYQTKPPSQPRFWVKLEDANTIDFEMVV